MAGAFVEGRGAFQESSGAFLKARLFATVGRVTHRDLSLYLWYNPSNFGGSKTDFFQNNFSPVYSLSKNVS